MIRSPGRGGLLAALLLLPALPGPLSAAVLVVPDSYPLQQALDLAASGDTILIRAGTYSGSFQVSGKDVALIGESGAAATILDGQNAGRVLDIGGGTTVATRLEGLTLARGRAAGGGGLRIAAGSGATLRDCRFEGNTSTGFEGGPGGGVMAGGGSRLDAARCLFVGNRGFPGAGLAAWGDLRLVESSFSGGFGYAGCGVYAVGPGPVEIHRSLFYDNRTWGEGGVVILIGAVGAITECTLAFNDADNGYGLLDTWQAPALRVERNLIALNQGFGLYSASATPRSCNDIWSNSEGQADPPLNLATGEFSLDPQFCAPERRELTLRDTSPCLPNQHPASAACGGIGRFGPGCVATPVAPTSWSAIKAMLAR